MSVHGEGQFVGSMPIIDSSGTVFPVTIHQTLPALTQMATAVVVSPVKRHDFVDEGTVHRGSSPGVPGSSPRNGGPSRAPPTAR